MAISKTIEHEEVLVPAKQARLPGDLSLPDGASGIVLFAHGSGSSRRSPRNRRVAETLQGAGLATLLFDLLTSDENEVDLRSAELRFDIDLLTDRLVDAVDWVQAEPTTHDLRIGLFGASTGAAAALRTAADRPDSVHAVVSRGGRPDLAPEALPNVCSPTLFIVGGADTGVLRLNRDAAASLVCEHEVAVVPGASHLFEEPGKLEEVSHLACDWFTRHLSEIQKPDPRGGR